MPADRMRIPLPGLCNVDAAAPVSPGIDREQWRMRVGAWRDALGLHAGKDIALACDDALEFSAALFGAWQAGVTPWLVRAVAASIAPVPPFATVSVPVSAVIV